MALVRWLVGAQAAMYIATGVWPLVHMARFEAVTGPKVDDWLVHTVGLLLAVIGSVLLAAAVRRAIDGGIVALAVGTALALAAIELVYVAAGTIARIYLLDAVIEMLLAAGVLAAWWARRPRPA
jgi:hypothetical protein